MSHTSPLYNQLFNYKYGSELITPLVWSMGNRLIVIATSSKIDRYEEIDQINLVNESIKYGIGSLPEDNLGRFGMVVNVVRAKCIPFRIFLWHFPKVL